MKKQGGTGNGTTNMNEPLWAYAYQMTPSIAARRMRLIRAMIDAENNQAKCEARRWTARLVTEQQVTHVMVVSDSPELGRESNRRLEEQLQALGVRFSLFVPMPVGGEAGPLEGDGEGSGTN